MQPWRFLHVYRAAWKRQGIAQAWTILCRLLGSDAKRIDVSEVEALQIYNRCAVQPQTTFELRVTNKTKQPVGLVFCIFCLFTLLDKSQLP